MEKPVKFPLCASTLVKTDQNTILWFTESSELRLKRFETSSALCIRRGENLQVSMPPLLFHVRLPFHTKGFTFSGVCMTTVYTVHSSSRALYLNRIITEDVLRLSCFKIEIKSFLLILCFHVRSMYEKILWPWKKICLDIWQIYMFFSMYVSSSYGCAPW
jgi:hypothetical protein